MDGDVVKDTIARGVSGGMLAYVGKSGDTYKPLVFEESLAAEEVEVSTDMFIITAEEAKKHIEPPRLSALTMQPERPHVKPGEHLTFQVNGLDQHGRAMPVDAVAWAAKGGEMDDKGGFKAAADEGEFLIEASAGEVRTQTTVVISKEETPPPPPPPPSDEVKGLQWSGDVPAQKWMNFYTFFFTETATTEKLKLTVTFEVSPEGGLAPHKVEEAKALLRELGLDDDVRPVS